LFNSAAAPFSCSSVISVLNEPTRAEVSSSAQFGQ
jgi:hypothetical protein